ncbi:MAG: hypothetical protein FIA93_10805 [Deltaproteobacteria bacterium]|nr:hypothetical protein [Deltaproteobacteria bacterium]
MKHLEGKGYTAVEVLFIGGYFVVLAFLLLVADPEWLVWAGPITLGALPYAAPKAAPAFDALETLQSASFLSLPGLLALIFLVRLPGEARRSSRSAAPEAAAEKRKVVTHAAPEPRKAA